MNQENDQNVSQMKERYLWGADTESRLKDDIHKVETDLKEDIQKAEENIMNAIQEIKDNHKRLVSRLF